MLNRYALTDPEFAERAQRFACEEVARDPEAALDSDTRHLAILAALVGSQSKEVYGEMLPLALDAGLSPVAVKEMVYQAVDYLGLGRALPFLDITNEVFALRGIALPLEGQGTTTLDDRLEKGAQAQAEILWRADARSMENGHDQPLAGSELLRRLLHERRTRSESARAHHLLFSRCPGRLRTAARRP